MTTAKLLALIWGPIIAAWVVHIGVYPLYITNMRAVKMAWAIMFCLMIPSELLYWIYG